MQMDSNQESQNQYSNMDSSATYSFNDNFVTDTKRSTATQPREGKPSRHQRKLERERKGTYKADEIAGYMGNKDLEELLDFIDGRAKKKSGISISGQTTLQVTAKKGKKGRNKNSTNPANAVPVFSSSTEVPVSQTSVKVLG